MPRRDPRRCFEPVHPKNGSGLLPFVGRWEEKAAIKQALSRGERLVEILGISGMGKSRLAREVADGLMAIEPLDAVMSCTLSGLSTAADLRSSLASMTGVGMDLSGDEWSWISQELREKGELLLILDSASELNEGALVELTALLERVPGLRLLVTAVRPLGLAFSSRLELRSLTKEEAAELYLDRAVRVAGERLIPARQREAIPLLMEVLDRIPLLIELAAARVRVIPPLAMLTWIKSGRGSLDLLKADRQGRLPSMKEAIDFSWTLLSDRERGVLAQASAFEGGFCLEAAGKILETGTGEADVRGENLILDLETLRANGLVQLHPSEPPRFTLYRCVREFALERLDQTGLLAKARRRHADYFLERCDAWVRDADAGKQAEHLCGDRENILAGHRWQANTGLKQAIAASLTTFRALSLIGWRGDEITALDEAVRRCQQAGEAESLVQLLELRADALRKLGRQVEARRDVELALDVARGGESRVLEARLWGQLAAYRSRAGETKAARVALARSLALARALGDPKLVAYAWLCLGVVEEGRGAWRSAHRYLERALIGFRRIGSPRLLGTCLLNLSAVLTYLQRYEASRAALEEARELARRQGRNGQEGEILLNLGTLCLAAGRRDEAEEHLKEALTLLRVAGNRTFEGFVVTNLGVLALERGEPRLARQRLREASCVFHEVGEKRVFGITLAFLAASEVMLGEAGVARSLFLEARSALSELGDELGEETVRLLEILLHPGRASELLSPSPDGLGSLDFPPSAHLLAARRLVEGMVGRQHRFCSGAGGSEGSPVRESPSPPAAVLLRVGPDASWFQVEGSSAVDLRRRGPLRRIFQGLVEQRTLAPGSGLEVERVVEQGWPNENIHPDAALNRVYNAMHTLRGLGLGELLQRHADGYLLDPRLSLERASLPLSGT